MLLTDNITISRYGYEVVSMLCRFNHWHNREAIHIRFYCLDWVNLSNDNLSTKSFGTHCYTFTAPAIASYNNRFARYDKISRTVNTVEHGLTCSIAIIE